MCNKYDTDSEFEYTITMCNLNNADTLEESIKSIANQVDNRFELLVVDDGSTDGSLEILERLEDEITNFRYVIGDNDNLGEARNHSFREANGEHILESMDLDDKYHHGILDFLKIYEKLYDEIDEDFYLKGNSINAASKKLLIKYPYRSMGYGEDADLWRRLFADDKIIWLDHEPFYEQMREDYTFFQKLKNIYHKTIVDFRSGISFRSFVYYCVKNMPKNAERHIYLLTISIPSYIAAKKLGRFDPPAPEFRKKGSLQNKIKNQSIKLQEFDDFFGIDTDEINISDEGKPYFYNNS
jgi:glycosyltransferase involved in cell wall biosynthesis